MDIGFHTSAALPAGCVGDAARATPAVDALFR